MIKYIVSIILTFLVAFVAGIYLPWWGVALAAFLVAVIIPQKPFLSFLAGFIGVFLLWELMAWWIDNRNNSILSQKIAQLFRLNSTGLLILVTALIGAIVAGLAALAGSYLRAPKPREPELPI
jgi:hypothetical protein